MSDKHWTDEEIEREAASLSRRILNGSVPSEHVQRRIEELGRRIRDGQKEADAKKCDAIAKEYSITADASVRCFDP